MHMKKKLTAVVMKLQEIFALLKPEAGAKTEGNYRRASCVSLIVISSLGNVTP